MTRPSLTLASRLRYEPAPTKGSRFVVTAEPLEGESAARQLLEVVASEMPDATHHCWAWRLLCPRIERVSDDGEPSGSAGRPILSQLIGRDVTDVAVVVSRYFGGTKLGIGGLVRAYGGAVGEAFDSVELIEHLDEVMVSVRCGYPDNAAVDRAVDASAGSVLRIDYQDVVSRSVSIAERDVGAFLRIIADATAGRARTEVEADG